MIVGGRQDSVGSSKITLPIISINYRRFLFIKINEL